MKCSQARDFLTEIFYIIKPSIVGLMFEIRLQVNTEHLL